MSGPTYPASTKRQARKLYEQGFSLSEISRHVGARPTTVKRWIDPEYDEVQKEKSRRRKRSYSRPCIDCGNPLSYSGGKKPDPIRCANCHREHIRHTKKWTRENIILAIQKWNEIYGRPPTSTEWNRTLARRSGKGQPGPEFPSSGTVYASSDAFATFADAIRAAGLEPRRGPNPGKPHRAFWTREAILQALVAHSKDGVAPLPESWQKTGGEDHPTAGWVVQKFGSWAAACREAGLDYTRNGRVTAPLRKPLKNEAVLIFVQELLDQNVLRSYVTRRMWREWGFSSERALKSWLSDNGVADRPGWQYRNNRQLTQEEVEKGLSLWGSTKSPT